MIINIFWIVLWFLLLSPPQHVQKIEFAKSFYFFYLSLPCHGPKEHAQVKDIQNVTLCVHICFDINTWSGNTNMPTYYHQVITKLSFYLKISPYNKSAIICLLSISARLICWMIIESTFSCVMRRSHFSAMTPWHAFYGVGLCFLTLHGTVDEDYRTDVYRWE